jgi:hypothetical protein
VTPPFYLSLFFATPTHSSFVIPALSSFVIPVPPGGRDPVRELNMKIHPTKPTKINVPCRELDSRQPFGFGNDRNAFININEHTTYQQNNLSKVGFLFELNLSSIAYSISLSAFLLKLHPEYIDTTHNKPICLNHILLKNYWGHF